MKLFIKSIQITGFKGYKDTVRYDLGNLTTIKGDNHLGKSSVGEAIVWCLTGCNLWGNEKATNDLVNNDKPKLTEVVLDFELDGELQTIVRRKKGASTDVYWNKTKSSTNDIAKDIFKGKNLFLSIFNPYYFPELTPKDAKQLLGDTLKPVKREDIFKELGEYLAQTLNDNGFRVPETFLADVRSDLREHEENIIHLEGALSELKPIEVLEEKTFDSTEISSLRTELEEINKADSVEIELAKLEKPKNIDAELNKLNLEELKAKDTSNIEMQITFPISSKRVQKDDLLRKYHLRREQLDNFDSKIVTCDKCGNEIDLTLEAKELLVKEIEGIKTQGKELAEEIKDLEIKNNQIEEDNKVVKEKIDVEISEKVAEIDKKKRELSSKYELELKDYEEKRQAIISKFEKENEGKQEKIDMIKSKISVLEDEEREVISHNARVQSAIEYNEGIAKKQETNNEKMQNSKNKIKQLKVAIDAGKQYNSIKLKKQSEEISKYLNRVTIQFEKLTKDGELKDDFKVLLDGKEFSKLSGSEKITAGLEIGNLLMNIQDLYFPIFVDDGERINDIPRLDTQMIVTKVTLDKEIKVEVEE